MRGWSVVPQRAIARRCRTAMFKQTGRAGESKASEVVFKEAGL